MDCFVNHNSVRRRRPFLAGSLIGVLLLSSCTSNQSRHFNIAKRFTCNNQQKDYHSSDLERRLQFVSPDGQRFIGLFNVIDGSLVCVSNVAGIDAIEEETRVAQDRSGLDITDASFHCLEKPQPEPELICQNSQISWGIAWSVEGSP
jgi:hypothetical protein